MKVHIINLDPQDDYSSARDKLSWARAPQVVLVWPRRGSPLNRRLDLVLVQRHAARLGLELGLVTFDPEVIEIAEQLKIPVYSSLEKLPTGPWSEPQQTTTLRRERPSLAELGEARDSDNYLQLGQRSRWIAVGISVAAVAAIALSVLPSAEIVMDPVDIPLKRSLPIWIDPSSSTGPNRVPGQTVSTEISGSRRIDTSGRVRLPQATASGEVEFTNLTGEEVIVPAGTGLRAGEIRFITSEGVRLGVGEESSARLPVQAAESGRSGNVSAGAIQSVEGPLGFLVTVGNHEPTSGGRDQVVAAVGLGDPQDLRRMLETELVEAARITLLSQLAGGFELAPSSLRLREIVDERYDVGLGEAADSLGLTLTLIVEGLAYSLPLATDTAEQEIRSTLPENRLLVPGSLTLEAVEGSSDWPAIEVTFAVRGSLVKTADQDLLRRSVLGGPKSQAADRLVNLIELDQEPQIETSPGWLPWIPWLGMRIDIKWVWESA